MTETLRSGPAFWPFRKMFLMLWLILICSVLIKVILYGIVAETFDLNVRPFWQLAVVIVPATAAAAYWIARWVKQLVAEADANG